MLNSFYTVAVREKRSLNPRYQYLEYDGENVRLRDEATHCKPLSREDAALAKRLLINGAKKAGRPIDARIVRLSKPELPGNSA